MKTKTDFSQMGIAALLPGMQYVVDQMQKLLDDMRESLGALQNGQPGDNRSRGAEKQRAYWARLTPEQRSKEVKRRLRKSKPKTSTDKRENYSRGSKSYWAKMTPEQRSKEMNRRIAKRAGK